MMDDENDWKLLLIMISSPVAVFIVSLVARLV